MKLDMHAKLSLWNALLLAAWTSKTHGKVPTSVHMMDHNIYHRAAMSITTASSRPGGTIRVTKEIDVLC